MMRKIQLTIWDWDDEKDTVDYMRLRWWERYSWLYEMMRKIQLTVWDGETDNDEASIYCDKLWMGFWENATLYHLFWHSEISCKCHQLAHPDDWWYMYSHTRLLSMFHCRGGRVDLLVGTWINFIELFIEEVCLSKQRIPIACQFANSKQAKSWTHTQSKLTSLSGSKIAERMQSFPSLPPICTTLPLCPKMTSTFLINNVHQH